MCKKCLAIDNTIERFRACFAGGRCIITFCASSSAIDLPGFLDCQLIADGAVDQALLFRRSR